MVAGDGRQTESVTTAISAETVPLPTVELGDVLSAVDSLDAVWTGPDEPTIATRGRIERLVAGGESRFARIKRRATTLFDRIEWTGGPDVARPRLLGGFAFFGSQTLNGPWEGFEPAAFHLPREQFVISEDGAWLTTFRTDSTETVDVESIIQALTDAHDRADADRGKPGIVSRHPRVADDVWKEHVRAITRTISDGVLRKAVLAQALDVELERPFALGPVFESLGDTYPDCYRFAFHGVEPSTLVDPDPKANGSVRDRNGSNGQVADGDTNDARRRAERSPIFFGASPERLVSTTGRDIVTEALAGTVERGEDRPADAALEKQLRTGDKLAEEHDVVVEQIESQLSAIGESVEVGDREVRKLARVQHLRSPIEARADGTNHVLDLVEALHPTPAVGGLPPAAAMSVIHEYETLDRGWYAGPVGWFDQRGDGTFAVGIRSAVAAGTKATLFAGNGIVEDSDPETEWAEVQLKFRPILDHLG